MKSLYFRVLFHNFYIVLVLIILLMFGEFLPFFGCFFPMGQHGHF